jgi:hypothetical protein
VVSRHRRFLQLVRLIVAPTSTERLTQTAVLLRLRLRLRLLLEEYNFHFTLGGFV